MQLRELREYAGRHGWPASRNISITAYPARRETVQSLNVSWPMHG